MKQPIFPGIAPEDDPDIEVTYIEEPSASAGLWAEVKSITRDIIFAAVMAVLIVVFVVQPVKVEGTSMLPRLENDERIFVNKFEYNFTPIERGDIIVFWYPEDPSKSFIKRVIGLPGETVDVRDGSVWINGTRLPEPYTVGRTEPGDPGMFRGAFAGQNNVLPYKVPPDCYFVMGDNRGNSLDSRFVGCIPRANIVGTPVMIYMSIDTPSESWGSGAITDRVSAYANALIHPSEVRWRRLFRLF